MKKNHKSQYLEGKRIAFNKKIGERFHPLSSPPPPLCLEEYPMEFAPDLITLAHPELEIKHVD